MYSTSARTARSAQGWAILFLGVVALHSVGWDHSNAWTWTTTPSSRRTGTIIQHSTPSSPFQSTLSAVTTIAAGDTWFPVVEDGSSTAVVPSLSIEQLKVQLLQLGAALDRGQSYNPTSGSYYEESMLVARSKIQQLLQTADSSTTIPKSLAELDGEWELVLTTVPHGIFRSSPFFLAIQESYEYAEAGPNFEDGTSKANLFFRLHELQTCSWGVSKIGRVAQRINSKSGYLYSEFDTSIFSLTVIPILGWFKLLPTFGGCVVTAATCELVTAESEPDTTKGARLDMVVDYTTSRKVPGLSGLPLIGDYIWKIKVPVGAIWKLLPWNKGRAATCKVYVQYVDSDFRIVQDDDGEYFVYTRPVVSRNLRIED
jgi:hypothetical protein